MNHVATIEYGFAALHSHLLGRAAKEGLLHPADVETALTTTAASMDAWKALAVEVRDIGWSTNIPMSISFLETYKITEHAIANSVKVLEQQDLIPLIGVLNTHVAVAYDLSAHLAEILETTDLEAPKAAIRRLAPEAGLFPSKQAQARHPGKFQKVAVLPQELIDKLVEKTDHIRVAHDKSVPSLIMFDAFHRPGYRTPTPFQGTSSPPLATRNGPAL
ncbi:MAG: hypothetical protein GX678_04330 [Actinomycetales bacterium]|nr:hypothetical protein [Actinomycetales bacterium]